MWAGSRATNRAPAVHSSMENLSLPADAGERRSRTPNVSTPANPVHKWCTKSCYPTRKTPFLADQMPSNPLKIHSADNRCPSVAPNVAGSNPVSHPNLISFHFPFKSHAVVVFWPVPICPTVSKMQPQPVKQQNIFLVQKRVNPIWLKIQMLAEKTALKV